LIRITGSMENYSLTVVFCVRPHFGLVLAVLCIGVALAARRGVAVGDPRLEPVRTKP
jgi:hypothetical protein